MGISLVIIDDEQLLRAGLRMLLDGAQGIEIVGEAQDGAEGVALIRRLQPDVALMDIRMPRQDGITAVRELAGSSTAVIMLTAFDTDDFILDALDAGASGFLLKDTPPEQLVQAVLRAAERDYSVSPTVLDRLVGLAGHGRRRAALDQAGRFELLTAREREIARAVTEGLTNAEIARKLYLGLPTVKTHLVNLYAKLEVSNRVQVALLVHDLGLDGA